HPKYYVLDEKWNNKLTIDDFEEIPIFGQSKKNKIDPALLEKFTNSQKLLEETAEGWERAAKEAAQKENELKTLRQNFQDLRTQLGLD
ncbi:hypothetical protein ABK046_46690, partial [Streptomyces caeruleatus]